jgi:hypothetical protein
MALRAPAMSPRLAVERLAEHELVDGRPAVLAVCRRRMASAPAPRGVQDVAHGIDGWARAATLAITAMPAIRKALRARECKRRPHKGFSSDSNTDIAGDAHGNILSRKI